MIKPEQQVGASNSSSSDHTTWSYNDDDTVQSVIDPRGASQTLTYNNRGLVQTILYSGPAGINSTAPVSYDYDAAGNRTSMTDGLGSISYVYEDQLSRLKSETRTITGIGTYALNYTYNLAGAMTSITDPFGAKVNYNFDGSGADDKRYWLRVRRGFQLCFKHSISGLGRSEERDLWRQQVSADKL